MLLVVCSENMRAAEYRRNFLTSRSNVNMATAWTQVLCLHFPFSRAVLEKTFNNADDRDFLLYMGIVLL